MQKNWYQRTVSSDCKTQMVGPLVFDVIAYSLRLERLRVIGIDYI